MKQNPILIKKYRGEVLESFHRGVVCLVGPDGSVYFSIGNIDQVCFPRSAIKLFQQIPLIESGAAAAFGLTGDELAVACASHHGESIHLEAVRSILRKAGLSEEYLQCGAHYPFDEDEKNKLIVALKRPLRIHNNCSGKHAAFLALAKYLGYPLEGYLQPDHPLQKEIKRVVAKMHECKEDDLPVAMDGCGAPIFGLSVYQQAVGYKNLCHLSQYDEKRQAACTTLIEAVTQNPYLVGGNKSYCTEMLQVMAGKVFGKTGADGVYSLAFLEKGIGASLKVDDGTWGMQFHVAQAIVEKMSDFKPEKFAHLTICQERIIRNWAGEKTGELFVDKSLFSNK